MFPLGLAYLYFGVMEYIYFFPFAAVTSGLAGLVIIGATVWAKE
ncbi:hypothetical protein [Pedobacter deserti]|nr:hypothetical protein [Pedobacter sp. SYSU D00382]